VKDDTVKVIDSEHSPLGEMGQKYLVSGKRISMRIWEDIPPGDEKPPSQRVYETIGYVLKGRAELHVGNHVVMLEPGSSWLVPEGTPHTYRVLEKFTAVEATSPPAQVHGRDSLI
jgi:mannose-6-phosphate isomerase-like protein (cupin superfamily)